MKERIEYVVKHSGLTKAAFAKKLSVSAPYITMICSGSAQPSDRTISDICREFGCNEIWLRTGEGEPFQQETRQEAILRFATQTVKGSDDFRKSYVHMLAQLDAEDWKALSRIFQKLTDVQNEK